MTFWKNLEALNYFPLFSRIFSSICNVRFAVCVECGYQKYHFLLDVCAKTCNNSFQFIELLQEHTIPVE